MGPARRECSRPNKSSTLLCVNISSHFTLTLVERKQMLILRWVSCLISPRWLEDV